MFKYADMFKEAFQMKKKMGKIQKELKKMKVEAEVAGGMVKVTADGQQNILRVEISQDLIDKRDKRLTEDLVRSAVNEAINRSRNVAQDELKKLLGDLPLSPDQLGL